MTCEDRKKRWQKERKGKVERKRVKEEMSGK